MFRRGWPHRCLKPFSEDNCHRQPADLPLPTEIEIFRRVTLLDSAQWAAVLLVVLVVRAPEFESTMTKSQWIVRCVFEQFDVLHQLQLCLDPTLPTDWPSEMCRLSAHWSLSSSSNSRSLITDLQCFCDSCIVIEVTFAFASIIRSHPLQYHLKGQSHHRLVILKYWCRRTEYNSSLLIRPAVIA